jgi:hypothetical protein
MEFRLLYRGPLKANGDKAHKHELRRKFHPQLGELWNQMPLKDLLFKPHNPYKDSEVTDPIPVPMRAVYDIGNFRFSPLVRKDLNLIAQLDIVLLRPGPPGAIITQGGDIDNRLKTLFDALRIPRDIKELPDNGMASPAEDPLYCLLEDDALITSVSVHSDRLLECSSGDPSEVCLLIHVWIKGTRLTWSNMGIIG